MSDFKTNEYAHLLGGGPYEPVEENPMLGFRGASRYDHPAYREGFRLECLALKKVREEMGFDHVKLMIPFCRTPEEGQKVIQALERNGLKRSGFSGSRAGELEIYMMCEIPSNVLLADQFLDLFDGFSIGSNDLTQLVLGVDRDSELLAPLFSESNPAVKKMISEVIKVAHEKRKKIGICGQAPSDDPEFAKFLVNEGISSLSLNPDSVLKTTLLVLDIEKKMRSQAA
jgi:pyruvate,water dikinase